MSVYLRVVVTSRWTKILTSEQKGSFLELSLALHLQAPQRIRQGWFDHQLDSVYVWSKE